MQLEAGTRGRRIRLRTTMVAALALTLGTVPLVHAGAGATGPHRRFVEWRETVDAIAIGTPACDASGVCIIPVTGTGLRGTGDFTATSGVAVAVARVIPGGTAESGLSTLVGTIRGCGTGTVTLRFNDTHDTNLPNGGYGRWSIVPGGGSAGLAHVTGSGSARFNPPSGAGDNGSSVLRGFVTC